tara:strand:+ start:805 stop:1053 length:249 start_codon:yes stop_codon:yes gene_type:complete
MSGSIIGWQVSIFISLYITYFISSNFTDHKSTKIFILFVLSMFWIIHTLGETYGDLQALQLGTITISLLINLYFVITQKDKK